MGVMWTEDQKKVIDLRNRNILVSAAAGSGKTAVLVERIMELVCDEKNPVDVDRLLVVTFTVTAILAHSLFCTKFLVSIPSALAPVGLCLRIWTDL